LNEVSGHYKRRKENVAVLDHFNLEIAEKDFVAIIGPTGSGKTTLLNLIGGLDHPSNRGDHGGGRAD
jgi:putative ABC transport system ATP-binding protein